MTALLALLLAAAGPATSKLAAAGFTGVGIEPARAQFFSDHFADKLNASGDVRVITQSEMAAMLGAERQRQLLGCGGEGGSCLAELAGALDARGVILGSVAKVGDEYAVQVKIVASDSTLLGLYSTRVKNEPRVLDFLDESAVDLAARLAPARPKASSRAWVVPAAVAGAMLVASVVCWVLAGTTWSRINSGQPRYEGYDAVLAARSAGQLQNTLGIVFASVGVAAMATTVFIGFTGVFD